MEENPLIEEDWNGSLVLILQTSPHTQSLAITASTVRTSDVMIPLFPELELELYLL